MLLGFKKRFAPKIVSGSKIHTVRAKRKVQPKIGEVLHMYTGLRTKDAELITKQHNLIGCQEAQIYVGLRIIEIIIDGRHLEVNEIADFCINDGFENIQDFKNYWLDGAEYLEFVGDVFHWTDFKY